jgi:hypothetical protein
MSFQWLQMRITEEKDRRAREAQILEQLPHAIEEIHRELAACMAVYTKAFGPESGEVSHHTVLTPKIRITIREEQNGKWEQRAKIEITAVTSLPGIRIDRGGEPVLIEVGVLPGQKMFYKDGDQFLTMEELTRRILDRAFFPKLAE